MGCTVTNPANGKESVLFEKFKEIFKNDEAAKIAYAKISGRNFKERFGDWVENYKNPNNQTPMGETTSQGEPKLFQNLKSKKWFFKDKNGDKDYIDKVKLSEFSAQEIEEVTNHFLYRFVKQSGRKSLNQYDPSELEKMRLSDSIEQSIEAYKESIQDKPNKEELLKRIELVAENKEEFRTELINLVAKLGLKVRERITDAEGNRISEVSEEDKGGGVNIKESYETNSKESATVNTKIMLSQIENRVLSKDMSRTLPVKDGFLEVPSFAKFDDVWQTLNTILVDEVGYGYGENVIDIFDVMHNKIVEYSDTKLWMDDLLDTLNQIKVDKDTNKITEFVQAFTKTELNFFVTEVNEGEYTIINATSTNKREAQLTKRWNSSFEARFLTEGKLLQPERVLLNDALKANKAGFAAWKEAYSKAGLNQEAMRADEIKDKAYKQAMIDIVDVLEQLGVKDIYDDDVNKLVNMKGGQNKRKFIIDELFKQSNFMIGNSLKEDFSFTTEDGTVENIFNKESHIKAFARAVGFRENDMADASVLLNDGKSAYTVSNPTYVSNKINEWKKDPSLLRELTKDISKKNSEWLNYLLAKNEGLSKSEMEAATINRLDALKAGLDASFTSKGRNDGVDNASITTNDQINANIVQMLNQKIKGQTKSYFPTIIAADKSRRILFEGLDMFKSGISTQGGEVHIGAASVELATGYFIDEYNRMKRVNRENSDDNIQKVVHYHGENGNGMKSQIFPQFNRDSKDPEFQELRDTIYGETFKDDRYEGFTPRQLAIVKEAIKKSLTDRVNEHVEFIKSLDGLSQPLQDAYEGDKVALAGDYFMNGLMSSVEYTKLFSGDPAYYKNNADLIKRIPATYTDGLQLRIKQDKDNKGHELIFNQATINGVEVASRYVDKILESVKDKSIALAYGRKTDKDGKSIGSDVNTTDAQAWITPRRWKFLKKGLGQWGPQHDKVYGKMISGQTMSPTEAKLAAQPLKGVYFETNQVGTHRPVYLKYSQAVLIPSLVKGTSMEALYNKMTNNPETGKPWGKNEGHKEVHEVVTIDGIKVGAVAPTSINKEGTTELLSEADITLNPQVLNNRGWKLQQDLPIKLMHDTNVGSQIQKNIFEGITDKDDYTFEGRPMNGKDLAKRMHETVSKLSNIGKKELEKKYGIDSKGNMKDSDFIYAALIEEFKDRGGNENIVEALEKGMALDSIPQIRGKVESIFMSIMNRALTKISTEGGSFIQVSPFGLETIKNEKPFEKTEKYKELVQIRKDFNEDFSSAMDKHAEVMGIGDAIFDKLVPEGVWNDGIIDPETGKGTPIDTQKVFGKSEEEMTKEVRSRFISWFNENAKREASVKEIILNGKKVDISNPTTSQEKLGAMVKGLFDKSSPVIKEYVSNKEGLGRAMINSLNSGSGKIKFNYQDDITEDPGITIVSEDYNGEALLPPRIENGKVLPGQAMIPHSQAVKILAANGINLADMNMKSAMAALDPSALELITYRIPNQGMSSNDYLQIVGVLPPGVGDSIVVYDGLPAKTGSDFDIDKLFVMQNHVVYDPETGIVSKLTADNSHLLKISRKKLPKNATDEQIREQDEQDALSHEDRIEKMLAQNELVAQYKSVLNSPATYDAMMRSIDGAQLKDDIVGTKDKDGELQGGLFPAPVMKNMELFSPLTQLRVKSEYLSGKMGVGQTANQLVDHVMNQKLDIKLNKYIGIGNMREVKGKNGKMKAITFFDSETTDSHSIADNLSAFLNAYVDIAKDPYIARANHNSITANTTFMLLRAGADLKWVNRFIGQPILKELVDLQMENQSITANDIIIDGAKGSPLEQIRFKYGWPPFPKNIGAATVEQFNEGNLEDNLRNNDDPSSDFNYEVLKAWKFLQEQGKIFGESVIAAKSDTAGTGGSNIDRLVNFNKIEKVINDGNVVNYKTKFKDTMLGTYKDNTLHWVRDVIRSSDLFISGTRASEVAFNSISFQTGNGPLLVNAELGKAIDNGYYSYVMSGTNLFKGNRAGYRSLTKKVPAEVQERKDSGTDNFLLQEFEMETRKGKTYLGINNKNKPTYYQNQIYRAWMDLYESYVYDENGELSKTKSHPDRVLALNLVKYAFTASGFQNNLSQFFTHIPHQILKDNNLSGEIRDMIRNNGGMIVDDRFVDQFQRHNKDNPKVVKTVKISEMEGNSDGFIYKPAKNKSQEISSKDANGNEFFPKFVRAKVKKSQFGKGVPHLYEKIGTVPRIDADNNKIEAPIYVRTFELGSSEGKYKTMEYSKGEAIIESNIPGNNLTQKEKVRVAAVIKRAKSLEGFKDPKGMEINQSTEDAIAYRKASDMSVISANLSQILEDKKIPCK